MLPIDAFSETSSGRYRFIRNDRLQEAPTVEVITRRIEPALTSAHCRDVLRRFLSDTRLYAIPIIDESKKPQFLIDRATFVEFFAQSYTREIFGKRSIATLLRSHEYPKSRDPIVIEDNCNIEDAAQIIIDAGMHHLVTGILVAHNGVYAGVVNGHDLLNLITQRKQAELFYLAHYDHLTGLPNRVLFSDRLQQASADARRHGHQVGLLFIDVDRFKTINDSLGHSFGDAILRVMASRLKTEARESDTVARLGGDEFVILMESINDVGDADRVAQRILSAMQAPFDILGHSIAVTVSIGIAIYPKDDTDISRLLAKADAAMYEAKASGRNDFRTYTEGRQLPDATSLYLANDLRHAIEQGNLTLHFQPQVRISTQSIEGVEALVRWDHPTRGRISPLDFIPLAEECGLIVRLGEWVLRESCRQLREWRHLGFTQIRISINVSALQFHQKDFVPLLREILAETEVAAHLIELELTESVLMQDAEDTLRILRDIRDLGVGLAIDDFGTGFSSLNYLRLFPINRLKIDQSFIRDIEKTPTNLSITRAIIALAESLALDITAEGIETASEKSVLESLGCREAQGYLFAKPMSAEQITELLREKNNSVNATA